MKGRYPDSIPKETVLILKGKDNPNYKNGGHVTKLKLCLQCEQEYLGIENSKYCSRKCHDVSQKGKPTGIPSYYKHGEANPNYRHGKSTKQDKICVQCGKQYKGIPESKHCSKKCADKSLKGKKRECMMGKNHPQYQYKLIVHCLYCGKRLRKRIAHVRNNKIGCFCDVRCYGKWLYKNQIQENHPLFCGNTTRYENFTNEKKKEVKELDGYKCVKCGNETDLLVHHIDGNKSNSLINNLITLCRSCHSSITFDEEKIDYWQTTFTNVRMLSC